MAAGLHSSSIRHGSFAGVRGYLFLQTQVSKKKRKHKNPHLILGYDNYNNFYILYFLNYYLKYFKSLPTNCT